MRSSSGENVAEFSAAVARVLTQPQLRAELAGAGRAFVEQRWSSREMARRLLALYEEVVRIKLRRFDDGAISRRAVATLERALKRRAPSIDR